MSSSSSSNSNPSATPTSSSPSYSYLTNPSLLSTSSFSFIDTSNRRVLLRGVNLSGASKAPVGHLSHLPLVHEGEFGDEGGQSDLGEEEDDDERVSFKNRPLNLTDGSADVHLARLRGWGFNMLRFPFTWEALEHAGPGIYDYEYMDYVVQCLVKCKEYGFRVFMDPHQDTWSRFSGGSGAPFWTLAACGIDPHNITATQAAILHSEYYPIPSSDSSTPQPEPEKLPAMVWSTNYGRLLSQTLFTLFFAGRDFAPNCIIDSQNIQDYLQSHFVEACGQLADRIAAHDASLPVQERLLDNCVIGWDSMNEPFEGLVGWPDLSRNPEKQGSTLKKGTWPTPAQSMRLGMGKKETVQNWEFGRMGPKKAGTVEIDPGGRKVWADATESVEEGDRDAITGIVHERPDGYHPHFKWHRDTSRWKLGRCIWAQHGVWDLETGYVLQPDYFRFHPVTRVEVEFLTDYWKPHFVKYAKRVKRAHSGAIMFVQPPVFAVPPKFNGVGDEEEEEGDGEGEGEDEGQAILANRAVYSPHYYDGLTLITRHWNWFNADALGVLRGKYSSPLSAVKIGESAIRRSLREQMAYLQADVPGSFVYPDPAAGSAEGVDGKKETKMLGQYPTLMGEIGTPFDMDGKRSYGWGPDGAKWKGNYENQERALDASLQSCDVWLDGWKKGWGDVTESTSSSTEYTGQGKGEQRDTGRPGESLNWTVWTYVPDDHSYAWGDGWNLEDLSLFSIDDLANSSSEDESGWASSESEEDAEEMYKANNGDNEEAMNSRAVLLKNAGTVAQDGVIARPAKTRTRTRKNDRHSQQQQPGRSFPMDAGLSSFSLATLGSGAAGASSTSLALAGGTEHQRRRRKAKNTTTTKNSVVKDDELSMRTVVTARSASPSSSVSSQTRSLASSKRAKQNNGSSTIHPYLDIAGYHPNPYVFLTAGARAFRAFARPWPVKVVGRAVDVRFDIAKGWFRMVVWVGEEDALVDENVLDGEDEGGRKRKEKLATEVYVPLVHYAHPRLVEDVKRGGMGEAWCRKRMEKDGNSTVRQEVVDGSAVVADENVIYPPSSPTTNRTPTPWSDSTTLPRSSSLPVKAPLLLDSTSPYLYSSSSSSSISKPHLNSSTDMGSDHEGTPFVDLDVSVSDGTTYAVRGQTLLWWYDPPTPGSGYKRKEYVLEIKRKGGVLEFPLKKDKAKSKSLGSKSRSEMTLCDALCPEGIGSCVIA